MIKLQKGSNEPKPPKTYTQAEMDAAIDQGIRDKELAVQDALQNWGAEQMKREFAQGTAEALAEELKALKTEYEAFKTQHNEFVTKYFALADQQPRRQVVEAALAEQCDFLVKRLREVSEALDFVNADRSRLAADCSRMIEATQK